jgi:hypothetical protein
MRGKGSSWSSSGAPGLQRCLPILELLERHQFGRLDQLRAEPDQHVLGTHVDLQCLLFTFAQSASETSAVLSTEGRVVGIRWEKLKPKGPKGPPRGLHRGKSPRAVLSFTGAGRLAP